MYGTALVLAQSCVLALLGGVAGCGSGGSGGAGAAPDVFRGEYYVQGLAVDNDTDDRGSSIWGVWTADGSGSVAGATTASNEDGLVSPGGPLGELTYSLGAGGSVAWQWAGGSAAFEGGVSADGDVLGIASGMTGPPRAPFAGLLLRRGGTFTALSLLGDYHVAGFTKAVGSDAAVGFAGLVNFVGGASTATLGTNLDGAIIPAGPFTGIFGIAANGNLSWTMDSAGGGDTYEGGVFDGGDFAMAAGGNADGDAPLMAYFLRHATAASEATLDGTYHIVGFEKSAGPTYDAVVGTLDADGAGNSTFYLKRNRDGVVSVDPASGATYTVGSNGTLNVNRPAGGLAGGISQDGSIGILGGGSLTGNPPGCFVFYK